MNILTTMKSILLLLFISVECFAQIQPGAHQAALAHSDIASAGDAFSLFNNPAGIALIHSREIGINYSPAPFEMKELSNAFASYCEPTDFGNFSAGFSIYGFELYKETQFVFGYGRNISRNFSIGASAIYKNITIKNYGSKGVFLFNLGAIAKINEQFGIGFSAENITRATINSESNQIPTVLWAGAYAKFLEELTFSIAARKELGFNPSLRLGAEYSLLDFVQVRFGVSNEPSTCSSGFGVQYEFMQFDYAFSSHPDLGFTHQFGLIVHFSSN